MSLVDSIYLDQKKIFFFLRLNLWHMEVPRFGVKLELQLLAYTTVTATPDPSCDLYHSSWQCRILNLLSESRDWTHILMNTSKVHFHWATMGIPGSKFLIHSVNVCLFIEGFKAFTFFFFFFLVNINLFIFLVLLF